MKENLILNGKTILVTGGAGFIGSALVVRLLKEMQSGTIVNIDCMTNYTPISIKEWRLEQIRKVSKESKVQYVFEKGSIIDKTFVDSVFAKYKPDILVALAAQAGVRNSIDNPDAYINTNIVGFYNLLEACRHSYDDDMNGVEHLVFASSSSVYGGNRKVPFSIDDKVDEPFSLYAATKKSNELMAYCYSKLYGIPSTGLRFFTVYGPAGRNDMFYYKATDTLVNGGVVKIFNYGKMERDFTYIDDIIEGVYRVMRGAPIKVYGDSSAPYAIYNIGGEKPENLLDFFRILQEELIRAKILPTDFCFDKHIKLDEMQQGDVPITYADADALKRDYGFVPRIGIREGLREFCKWYKEYYG